MASTLAATSSPAGALSASPPSLPDKERTALFPKEVLSCSKEETEVCTQKKKWLIEVMGRQEEEVGWLPTMPNGEEIPGLANGAAYVPGRKKTTFLPSYSLLTGLRHPPPHASTGKHTSQRQTRHPSLCIKMTSNHFP